MKEFEIRITIFGSGECEDPKCPISWMGSGVYMIDVQDHKDAIVRVIAKDEEEAKCLVKNYTYYDKEFSIGYLEFADIDILSVRLVSDDCDDEDDISEVFDVEYV